MSAGCDRSGEELRAGVRRGAIGGRGRLSGEAHRLSRLTGTSTRAVWLAATWRVQLPLPQNLAAMASDFGLPGSVDERLDQLEGIVADAAKAQMESADHRAFVQLMEAQTAEIRAQAAELQVLRAAMANSEQQQQLIRAELKATRHVAARHLRAEALGAPEAPEDSRRAGRRRAFGFKRLSGASTYDDVQNTESIHMWAVAKTLQADASVFSRYFAASLSLIHI